MKQETKVGPSRRTGYWVVAVLCLIFGGISLIVSIQQAAFLSSHERAFPSTNRSPGNITRMQGFAPERGPERFREPFTLQLVISLCGSVISILGGTSLLSLLRAREIREIKREIMDSIILPDERRVIIELERGSGEMTQSELVHRTKLSKVKVHRIVKRLESLGIVKKYPYGMTNKIKLEKRFVIGDIGVQ